MPRQRSTKRPRRSPPDAIPAAEGPARLSEAGLARLKKIEAEILSGKAKGRPIDELMARLARRA
jgi:hypothetical protein